MLWKRARRVGRKMHSVTPIVIVLLVLFSIYRRAKRTIGFQRFVKGRMITRLTLFGVVGGILLVAGYVKPVGYIFDVIGIVAGGIMAYYAARTTSFEWRKDAWYYRAHPWIGVVLLVLLVLRIGYRLYQDYTLLGNGVANGASANNAQLAAYAQDPSTTIILFVIITYYIAYYIFLIRRERHLKTEPSEPGSPSLLS